MTALAQLSRLKWEPSENGVQPHKGLREEMGFNLAPIAVRKKLRLEDLRGMSLAVDANNMLYQFLSLVRTPDGTPLKDSRGNVTSHLAGLLFRTTRLLDEYDMTLTFVFDGRPPSLKCRTLEERRNVRERAREEWRKALKRGDYAKAWSKALVMDKLSQPMIDDAKRLLDLLGVPWVQAPAEAEAQAAYMADRGAVWASNSRDYDSILFGAPRLVRYVTISGQEFLPSKGVARPLEPEIIELQELLAHHRITREQLVDAAIIVGTDFNEGIRGIGPKTAIRLIRRHKSIESLPSELLSKLPAYYEEVRKVFLRPEVTGDYDLTLGRTDEEALFEFMCRERDFSRARVETAVERMRRFYKRRAQQGLGAWLGST